MILGFKPHFVSPIYTGKKIHTIRGGQRWKAGNKIHMAIGVRTKNYKQFNRHMQKLQTCFSVQDILIAYVSDQTDPFVCIDDKWWFFTYSNEDKEFLTTLAKNDGFESFEDFCKWFDKDFVGQIIHWTDKRY